MTLLSSRAVIAYEADGATRNFPVPFRIWSPDDLQVHVRRAGTLVDELCQPGSGFTWDASPLPGPGAVVFPTPPPPGARVVIERNAAILQELDLIASGAFAAETIEDQFDRITAHLQSLQERLARAPQLPPGSAAANPVLPEPHPARAGQLLGIAADGQGYDCKVPAALGLQTVSAFAATLLDDPDAATARATLGIGSTIDLNLLPPDATGGAAADFIPFVDASEANASNRVAVPAFMANAAGSLGALALAGDTELIARSPATGAAGRLPASLIGAGRQTVWIPAAALVPRLTAGAAPGTQELAANRLTLRTLDFDPLVQEHAQVLVQMPRAWNRGALSAVIAWSHGAATGSFGVTWGLRVLAASDALTLEGAFGPAVTVTDTGASPGTLYRTPEAGGLAPATPAPEAGLVALEVFRAATDAADTLPVDARLLGVTLFYATAANTDA